jgi:phage gp45-like
MNAAARLATAMNAVNKTYARGNLSGIVDALYEQYVQLTAQAKFK